MAASDKAKKETKTKQHWNSFRKIKALKGSHPEVRRLKSKQDNPSIHGNKVWSSSFVLIDYLYHNPLPKGAKVLDVGCGWGLTGIWLAKTYQAEVLAMDADPAVEPYLKLQADLNKTKIEFRTCRFEELRKRDFEGVHTLIGGDVCFWDELIDPLFGMLKRAQKMGVNRSIIGDPGRPTFWSLAGRVEDKLDGEVLTHRIKKPRPAEKPLLIVRG